MCKFDAFEAGLELERKIFGVSMEDARWEEMVEAEAASGVLSASALACKFAVDAFYVTPSTGKKRMGCMLGFSLLFALLVPATRVLLGHDVIMGVAGWSRAINVMLLLAKFLTFGMIVGYISYPGIDCLNRVKVASHIDALVGEGVDIGPGADWFNPLSGSTATVTPMTQPSQPEDASLAEHGDAAMASGARAGLRLNVDMRLPENVLAWACLHKCLEGGEFGRSYYMRYQGYNFCVFWCIIVYLLAMSMLVKFEGSVDFVVALDVMVRVLVFLLCVIVQIFIAYSINLNCARQKAKLVKEKVSIQAQLSCSTDVEDSVGVDRQRMRNTCEMLDSVGEQISLQALTQPMRVMALPAAPPAITFALGVSGLAFSFAFEAWSDGTLQLLM